MNFDFIEINKHYKSVFQHFSTFNLFEFVFHHLDGCHGLASV